MIYCVMKRLIDMKLGYRMCMCMFVRVLNFNSFIRSFELG
jgi:hypothetical protein